MNLINLKRTLLAAFPVVGPHDAIEADLMLAGKKPLTWVDVYDDVSQILDRRLYHAHIGRLRLDEAVAQGRLLAADVEQVWDDPHVPPLIVRHYAQPAYKNELSLVVEYNKLAFNTDHDGNIQGKDMGEYVGYRKRDIALFGIVGPFLRSTAVPQLAKEWFWNLNDLTQVALREKLLIDIGIDPAEWRARRAEVRKEYEREKVAPRPGFEPGTN